ncbi:hypothetical protein D3C72_821420 [compost metagenome]
MPRLAKKSRKKGDHRTRRDPRRQRIEHETRLTSRVIHPARDRRAVSDMPMEPALTRHPVLQRIQFMPLGNGAQMRLRQWNDPA